MCDITVLSTDLVVAVHLCPFSVNLTFNLCAVSVLMDEWAIIFYLYCIKRVTETNLINLQASEAVLVW